MLNVRYSDVFPALWLLILGTLAPQLVAANSTTDALTCIWIEVVPFAAGEEASWWHIDAKAAADRMTWDGAEGQAIVCNGVETGAVHCRTQYLQPKERFEPILAPGVSVTGQVMVERDPVVGARVALTLANLEARKPFLVPLDFDANATEPRRHVKTDAEGRFVLPQLGPGMYRLEVQAPGGRIDVLDAFAVPGPEPLHETDAESLESKVAQMDLGQIELPRGLSVHFTVSSAAGEALDGAKVAASQPGDGQRIQFSGETNTEGEAWLTGMNPDQPLHALCRASGFVAERQEYESPPTDVHCFLDPLAKLRGRVLHGDEPVADAVVSFELPSRFAGALPGIAEIAVATDGRFEAENLHPSTYRLIVAAPGFRVEERILELAAGETKDLDTIELSAAAELWGLVRDAESGEPIAGAQLTSLRPPGAVQTVTDETGEFRSASESDQPIRVRVFANGYPPLSVELPPDPTAVEQPFVIDLEAGGWIDVLAYDDESGLPCAGCPIVHDLPGVGPAGLGRGSDTTDLNGQVRFGPLPVGRHHVILEQVRSEGSTVTVTSGGNMQTADVRAGETVQVVFGAAARDIQLRLWPPPLGWQLQARDGAGQRTLPANTDGTFTLRHSGKEVELRLTRPGTSVYVGRIPADFDRVSLDLDLPAGSLRGILDAPPHEVRLVSTIDPRRTAWTLTNADGTFGVPYLAAGTYQLVVDGETVRVVSLADGEQLSVDNLGSEEEPASAALAPPSVRAEPDHDVHLASRLHGRHRDGESTARELLDLEALRFDVPTADLEI